MAKRKLVPLITTIRVVTVDPKEARKLMGGLVKAARKRMGLTQEETCYMLGIGRPQLCDIEIGNSGLSAESLIRAVINLGISITPETFGAHPPAAPSGEKEK